MEFCLGAENSSGIKTFDEEDFVDYIREAIADARKSDHDTFELTWENPVDSVDTDKRIRKNGGR